MKIIKNNYEPKVAQVTCPWCSSIFEFEEKEVYLARIDGRWASIYSVECPCCDNSFTYRAPISRFTEGIVMKEDIRI